MAVVTVPQHTLLLWRLSPFSLHTLLLWRLCPFSLHINQYPFYIIKHLQFIGKFCLKKII